MAIEIRIISADGEVTTVAVDPNTPIELQAGDTVVLLPDGETTITPQPNGDNLVIANPDGDIVFNNFYVEEEGASLPNAVAFYDNDGFKLLTPSDTLVSQSHTVPKSHTLPVYEGVNLPENGQLPESFDTTSLEARAQSLENLLEANNEVGSQGSSSNDSQSLSPASIDDAIQNSAGTSGNDAPLLDLNQGFSVAESAGVGTGIGSVGAIDPDGDTLTFAITAGNDDGTFAIDPSTGQLTIADGSNLDFETSALRSLTISVTDPDGASDTTDITIKVLNSNDAPVVVASTFAVDENSTGGTAVGTVTATDSDVPAQMLSYAIVGGTGAGQFVIDAGTGAITVDGTGPVLDRESTASLTLDVRVTDNGIP